MSGAATLAAVRLRLRHRRQDPVHRRQWRGAELHLRRDAAGDRRRLRRRAGELRLRPGGQPHGSHLSASYSHDTANRLREDEDACYEYDENGNLIDQDRAGRLRRLHRRRDILRVGRAQPPGPHRQPGRHIFGLPLRRPGPPHREGRQRRVNQIRLRWRRNPPGIRRSQRIAGALQPMARKSTSRWP